MRPPCEISSDRRSTPRRKILGEIEAPLDERLESQVRTWLVEALGPLNLQASYLNRLLDSARDAIERLASSESSAAVHGQIHIILSGPERAVEDGETWGFFRIEKLEGPARDGAGPDPSIELYLYAEGD